MAVAAPITWQMRGRHFIINLLAFALCYPLANLLAAQKHITRNVALPFESALPFVPWMIIPYLSSGFFFAISFAWVRSADDLRVLSQRLLLATVCATLVFAWYPLQFSMARPAIDNPLFAGLFALLSVVDRPYNQLPSLHVAFCFIFWRSLQTSFVPKPGRTILSGWLALVAIATVFTYQHQVLDVVAGLMLGWAATLLVRHGRMQANVAFYYLMAAGIVLLLGVSGLHCRAGLYLVASLSLVSFAYFREDRFFLHKRDGRHPLWVWLLYAPYLAAYWLTWRCVRWRERRRPPLMQIGDRLWIGRRLSAIEAELLPAQCVVIDLANELSETPSLRKHDYHYFPLPDLRLPQAGTIDDIVALMIRETGKGQTIYLHCAMGYSRSTLIAKHYMEKIAQ
ncbi:MAG: phosphatase PAP2 family protein [Collimonas sp.]|uniref:phosphatase PAP2 family protein n=1 Tax=Collimonas sp. TaxID=1963772 RepID=UPI003265449B